MLPLRAAPTAGLIEPGPGGGPQRGSPSWAYASPSRWAVVTYALIALNVLAYLFEQALVSVHGSAVLYHFGLVPLRLVEHPTQAWHTIFTSMFMHAPETWWHIAGNMLFLVVFGRHVENGLGRTRFLMLYLGSGIIAAFAQVLVDPASTVPMVGASGAIAGVLAGYGSLYPRSPVTVLNPFPPLWILGVFTFTLPAWLVILEFFVMNLLGGLTTLGAGSGVAFFAHVGGFVAGLFLVRLLFKPPPPDRDPWHGWQPPPPSWPAPRRIYVARPIDPRRSV
jgi:membrane associated rhomboid family serine protease